MKRELPKLIRIWPARWFDAFTERAAIMEFDAGMTREEANKKAEACVREEFAKS